MDWISELKDISNDLYIESNFINSMTFLAIQNLLKKFHDDDELKVLEFHFKLHHASL